MQQTRGGIAVDRVSMTHTGVSIYGNDKLLEWIDEKGVHISRIRSPGGQMELYVMQGDGPKTNATSRKAGFWYRSYGTTMPATKVPKFGQTKPVKAEFRKLGNDDMLVITLPEPDKRAPLLRGRNKPKNVTEGHVEEKPTDVETEKVENLQQAVNAPATDPLLELTNILSRLDVLYDQLGGFTIARSLDERFQAQVTVKGRD